MPAVVVLIKYKIVVLDEVYILFHFNIILKHNGMSSTKTKFGCISSTSNFENKFEDFVLFNAMLTYVNIHSFPAFERMN
jgi:hypothetical protein